MKKIIKLVVLIPFFFYGCLHKSQKPLQTEYLRPKYEETWKSLAHHNEQPKWFLDAKFGIYFHWGVYSVPAFGDEWYPRWMHFESRPEYKNHLKKYGHPSEFGYHDFIPMFKAEKFSSEEWAELFKKAGASFAGPVAEHHDGFSMWDSKVTPWNTKNMGPKRDITGELEKSIKSRGMKFITTFHHAKNLQRHDTIPSGPRNLPYRNSHYPFFEGMPPRSDDPDLRLLYGNIPEEEWYEKVWFAKLKEVIDKYQPDIIWFDSWLDFIPENYRLKFCAYYLNEAEKLKKEVVIVRKQDDLPLEVSVDDLEKSRKNKMGEKVWMTDETVSTGSWCYTENLTVKNAADILHVLIDVVSKNGILLLNISPKADGTIPEGQKEVLLSVGEWLSKYGEAIYKTRPWYIFGEGPTKEPEGHFKNREEFLKIKYTADDVRYTQRDSVVYAILMGQPDNRKGVLMKAFSENGWNNSNTIESVELVGSEVKLMWEHNTAGLVVNLPEKLPSEYAQVLKISTL